MVSFERLTAHKPLHRTFDPPPAFATVESGVASNAPELRRYVSTDMEVLDVLHS
jgi:hypothetical protein